MIKIVTSDDVSLLKKVQDAIENDYPDINLEPVLEYIVQTNGGYILVNDDLEFNYYIALDANSIPWDNRFKLARNYFPKSLGRKEIEEQNQYLYDNLIANCWTTYIVLTNYPKFYDNPLAKALLDSHLNYNFICLNPQDLDYEEFNEERCYEYGEDEFYYDSIETYTHHEFTYGKICRHPELLMAYDDDRIKTTNIILPKEFKFKKGKAKKITLDGFKSVPDKPYFIQDPLGSCEATLYSEVSFDDFYPIEHSLDIFNVTEGMKIVELKNAKIQSLIFYTEEDKDNLYFPNIFESLQDFSMRKIIADMYCCIPAKYDDYDRLFKYSKQIDNNFLASNIVTGLIFQENFEYGSNIRTRQQFNNRIKRLDLETINIILTEELHYNYYSSSQIKPISIEQIPSRVLISVDLETHTAVLFLICLSGTDLASKYLDMVSRNDLFISISDKDAKIVEESSRKDALIKTEFGGKTSNIIYLYDYLEIKYGISKVGTAKNMILSPYIATDRFPIADDANRQYVSSILYSEAVFEEEEELGKIIDQDIEKMFKNPYGDAIYDYSNVYISKSTVLQGGETYRDYAIERIDFAVVMLFYLELICFELSAILIASNNISLFINSYQIKGQKGSDKKFNNSSEEVLDRLDEIYEEYAKTLDFWDAQMNYVSSKKSLDLIRNRFEVNKYVESLKRNRNEVEQIYQSRKTKISNRTSHIVSIVAFLFTIVSAYDIIIETINENVSSLPEFVNVIINNINKFIVILAYLLIMGILNLVKFIKKRLFEKKEKEK